MARCPGRRRDYRSESGPRRPAERPRIAQIRDNLIDRIAEAGRDGWPGGVEGLTISLAGADNKLGRIDRRARPAASASACQSLPGTPERRPPLCDRGPGQTR